MTWRSVFYTAKVAIVTAVVVSIGWLAVGAIYWPDGEPAELAPARGTETAAPPMADQTSVAMAPIGSVPSSEIDRTLIVPVSGITTMQLADTFSQSRANGARRHDAIDIMAPLGTPVVAAAAGRVEKLFVSEQGGNTVYVRSPDRRTIFYYAHLQNYAPELAEGQYLTQGSPIGTVGATGNALPAGPHLHFAMYDMAPDAAWSATTTALNPYPALVAGQY
jgi:murein DD-endopeptidase MepM/ murein hydrolase activator NlpD